MSIKPSPAVLHHAFRFARVVLYTLGASPVAAAVMNGQSIGGRAVFGAIVAAVVAADAAVLSPPDNTPPTK